MFFEIYDTDGNLKVRGKQTLEPLSWENEMMYTPSCDLVLPIDYLQYLNGREEVKIYINDKCFWGIVWDLEPDKAEEKLTVSVRHVISEWEYRQISVNHAISDKKLNIVYKGEEVEEDKKNDETITATSFSIIAKSIKKMTTAKWIEKAHAVAWVTSNGDKVAVTNVDSSKVKKEDGTYKVTFSTAKGTSVTVECTVVQSIDYGATKTESSKANKETISARPFTVQLDMGMTADKVKEKVKAKAWVYRHKNQKVEVTSITTNFQNKVGRYDVTASTAKGTSITVHVTVEDGDTGTSSMDASVVDKLEDIYANMEFAYPGWEIQFRDDSENEMIDYVYSKQNKLEALTQTMELTDDLFWRVGFQNRKQVQIGKFGDKKPYIISKKPSGKTNIHLISEPVIDYDFENVINVATVYSDKSDSGMASLTLREVYNDADLLKRGKIDELIQDKDFPVIILRGDVNNERDYAKYYAPNQSPKVAPNNELEFAIVDVASVALESGKLIEGSFAFNDLNPFEVDENKITDKKRIRAAKAVYKAAIRKLKQSRRSYNIKIVTEEIPSDLWVGDKVRFIYDNNIWNMDACSSYWKKILSYDDWFYVSAIGYEFDENGVETNELTLTKWLKIERETQVG